MNLTDEEINNDSLVRRISYGVVDLLMTMEAEVVVGPLVVVVVLVVVVSS